LIEEENKGNKPVFSLPSQAPLPKTKMTQHLSPSATTNKSIKMMFIINYEKIY